MAVTVSPQTIVCPKCEQQFNYNKVNGIAMLEVMTTVESKKKMHCRLTLNTLERELKDTPYWPIVKKAVLDGYNDLARDVFAILGLEVE